MRILEFAQTYLPVFQLGSYIIGTASVIVAMCALIVSARAANSSATSARQAQRAHDFKTLYDVRTTMRSAWRDYTNEKDEDRQKFLFGEFLNDVEQICAAINSDIITKDAKKIISGDIILVIKVIINNKLDGEVRRFRTRKEVYQEIIKFVKDYKGTFEEQAALEGFLSSVSVP
jgi:hypothetical protein